MRVARTRRRALLITTVLMLGLSAFSVQAALRHGHLAPGRSAGLPAVPSLAAARHRLVGSPAVLAALHAQAGRLLGGVPGLTRRLRALRGYPVILNAWSSWCGPCRQEAPLLAAAAVRYGRHLAFLGVDTADDPVSGRAFLARHPLSYPSYQSQSRQLPSLGVLEGLPTTIFIDSAGHVVDVHTGQYYSVGQFRGDIVRLERLARGMLVGITHR